MATQVKVISTEDRVYATYVETICFDEEYEQATIEDVLNRARAVAFSYAVSFGTVQLMQIHRPEFKTKQDIFDYLKSQH